LETKEIKRMAYQAAKHENISVEGDVSGMTAQERLYYLEMLYYYLLFDSGRIPLTEAQKIEQKINAEHLQLDNALWLSQEEYKRAVQRTRSTNVERTKLCKQLLTGDHDFIHTLLHLLNIYTGEGIYDQMYQIMQAPLNDKDLDSMIDECPEQYSRKMTMEEKRTAVWHIVDQLQHDKEIR
jgi:hypothetical protein